jgi:hypothetical protein
VRNGSNIILTKFINKNVVYLVLLPIKTNNKFIIIKIGFTDNIVNRLKTLKDEPTIYKVAIFSNFIEENLYIDNKLKYDYLITIENNNHAKYMAKLKYDYIDKEIALLDKQIELAKLQNSH